MRRIGLAVLALALSRPVPVSADLRADYFDNRDLTGQKFSRIDASVNNAWGSGSPGDIDADTFSIRWTGQVVPQFSETYTFYTLSDDGVRLWVNGQLLIDNWTDHAVTENSATIALVAGQAQDIRMEFFENGGNAVAKLSWSSPSQSKQIIPSSRLLPRRLRWEFTADSEGWSNIQGLTSSFSTGVMTQTITGANSQMQSPDRLAAHATFFHALHVRMKNNTPHATSRLYWQTAASLTSANPTWSEDRRLDFTVVANDTKIREYVVDLGTVPTWVGTIERIRIDPLVGAASGSVEYGQIYLSSYTGKPVDAIPLTRINFQPDIAFVPAGYLKDIGLAYNEVRGRGFVRQDNLTPLDVTPNTRDRNRSGIDQRLDTLVHLQYPPYIVNPPAVKTPAAYEHVLGNGMYRVAVSVGDQATSAGNYDSLHVIRIEGAPGIAGFQSTSTREYRRAMADISVVDGKLTIDAVGGVNTKINYLDIDRLDGALRPSIRATTPGHGSVGVDPNGFVSVDLALPATGVDASTVTSETVKLLREDGVVVLAERNVSGGSDVVVLQPKGSLEPNTRHFFSITSGLKDLDGWAFVPFTSSFTTGESSTSSAQGFAFDQVALPTATGRKFTALAMGPDGKLYAAAIGGDIVRFALAADGTTGTGEVISTLRDRLVLGLAFDPTATSGNLILWATHSARGGSDWTGKLSKLTGSALAIVQDVLIGLPRSTIDHATNSIVFNAGNIYLSQAGLTALGAPTSVWGMRPERTLSAAILRLDRTKLGALPLDVKTAEGGTYNPFAINAPLTIFASGFRNAYDLLWHSNGQLYVPTNGGAAGGAALPTPSTPSSLPASCGQRIDGAYTGPAVPGIARSSAAQRDFLFRVVQGGYYGHPNPARCEWVLNGGNPTSGVDSAEVSQYPVGTLPDRNWRGFAYDFGVHYSPNGVIEYKNNFFGSALKGKLLVTRYSGGDDILVLSIDSTTKNISQAEVGAPGLTGFKDPLDIVENPTNGYLYVAEHGGQKITLLKPRTPGPPRLVFVRAGIAFSDVYGDQTASTKALLLRNDGDKTLIVTALRFTGPAAAAFSTNLALPKSVAPGKILAVPVSFKASSRGPSKALIEVDSNDPVTPRASLRLGALGTYSIGGSGEPSLQWLLTAWGIAVNVGDPDAATSALPNSPLLGEEISAQRFERASTAPITVEALGAFGAQSTNPALRMGYYTSGVPSTKKELFTVANNQAQTADPIAVGALSFDPGTGPFGFYSTWPPFSNREVFQEDYLNLFGSLPHNVRVYPLKTESGIPVSNAYVVATEETTTSTDYQDIVFVVRNVKPITGPRIAYDTSLLTSNRIGTLAAPPANGVHATNILRIVSSGASTLTVSALTFTGPWALASAITLPTSIPVGGKLDVTIAFQAQSGAVHQGSLAIATNDPIRPSTTVQLKGFWQSVSEGGQEPSLAEILQVFGYKTVVGQPLNKHGLVQAIGDEVLSPYWVAADPTLPIRVRQLAAFHSWPAAASIYFHVKGSSSTSKVFTIDGQDAQSLLPRVLGSSALAAGAFMMPDDAFGLKVDGEWSDPSKNSQGADMDGGCPGPCGHHVRFWRVKDLSGVVLPWTFVMAMDYSGINYDYNDNVYLVQNVRPEE